MEPTLPIAQSSSKHLSSSFLVSMLYDAKTESARDHLYAGASSSHWNIVVRGLTTGTVLGRVATATVWQRTHRDYACHDIITARVSRTHSDSETMATTMVVAILHFL